MLDLIDTFIATLAVILGLSLIVQAIQQLIKQGFELKSSYMRDELAAMFIGNWRKIRGTAAISSLEEASREQVRKLVGLVEDRVKGIGFKDLEVLENIDGARLKEIFRSVNVEDAVAVTGVHPLLIRQEIEQDIDRWFDIAKQAFQDHYERRMKVWAFAISAAVVVGLNVNLFDVYSLFSANRTVREAGVALAEKFAAASADSLMGSSAVDTAGLNPDSARVAAIKERTRTIGAIVEDRSYQLFGWRGAALERIRARSAWENTLILPLGWIAMALLVSLGAPFWYDLLKTLFGIKNIMMAKSDTRASSGSSTPSSI